MTTARKTTTMFFTVLCGLLLTIVGLVQRWPGWTWPALAAVLLVLPAATFRVASQRRGPVPVSFEEQLTAAPVERTEYRVNRVTLPSLWDDYHFVFSATVRWCFADDSGRGTVVNPAGLAVDAVHGRARAIAEKQEPGHASLLQHELGGALSRMCPDSTGHLRAMAEDISLTLPDEDQERLDRLAGVRKDEAVWEHQRKYEQSKRRYLGEDVLKDTGSAVVWWLTKNNEHVAKTVADLPLLAQLTSAANDTDIPERLLEMLPDRSGGPGTPDIGTESADLGAREPSAADHLSGFFEAVGFGEDDDRRAMLARQFSQLIEQHNRHETAEDLLRRFDPPRPPSPETGAEPAPDHGPPAETD
ncbi:hypothetical protein ACFV2H_35740 [Streptomyces sp. NPDC059629]|uniref:hypothetical protein n=1 Tax=Streptomyces sp. NPDC059629 TaxID=3346889 RepID=UPI0036D064EF